MYSHILEAALREHSQRASELTTDEVLAILSDCRQSLALLGSGKRGANWGSAALAKQVAYDLALIDLAKSVGLDVDSSSFDQPESRRIELEYELIARGIQLVAFEQ
jgi:hypothetical protein